VAWPENLPRAVATGDTVLPSDHNDTRTWMASLRAELGGAGLKGIASTLFDRLAAMDVAIAALGGGPGGIPSGPGPNWVAASNAPTAVKNAVLAAGGVVCTGTNDHTTINSAMATYKAVRVTEGTYTLGGQLVPGLRCSLIGAGMGATKFVGASSFTSGSFFLVNTQDVTIRGATITRGSAGTSVRGLEINISSNSGWSSDDDSNGRTVVEDLLIIDCANGVYMPSSGTKSNNATLNNVTAKRSLGVGFYINVPDGRMIQCMAGSCGTTITDHGFHFDTNTANWSTFGCAAWFSRGDGWYLRGIRNEYTEIMAQDNAGAGIRFNENFSKINGFTCDSNSYRSGDPFGTNGVYSGLEIGLKQDGTSQGGDDLTICSGQSWDKNEGGRGRYQKYGIRAKAGIRRLVLTGFNTGDPSGSHFNVTDGVYFNTPSDVTHATNIVSGLSHGVKMSSSGASPTDNWARLGSETAVTSATPTEVTTALRVAVAASTSYAFEAFIMYRADATDDLLVRPVISGGGGTPTVEWTTAYEDTSSAAAGNGGYRRFSGTNTATAATPSDLTAGGVSTGGAGAANTRTLRIVGTVWAGNAAAIFTILFAKAVATSGNDAKVVDGSWVHVRAL
jgi:hypothetical protein